MAGKPRVTVRLESSVVALLEWYAAARAIPPAELAAELIGAGVLQAVADADLRGLVIDAAGPPPAVPLAAIAAQPPIDTEGVSLACAMLRSCADEIQAEHPATAARMAIAAECVEGYLVLLRDAVHNGRRNAARAGAAPVVLRQEAAE